MVQFWDCRSFRGLLVAQKLPAIEERYTVRAVHVTWHTLCDS